MHCTNCGTFIAVGARFCAGCGAPATDPEMTRVAGQMRPEASLQRADKEDDIERTVFTARPTLLFIKAGYVAAALGGILLVILLALVNVSVYISIPLALALLLIPAYYHIKRNLIRYTLTDSKIEIDQGLIARTTRNIPLRNIQDVTVSASIPQRLLGFGNVVIENASETGGTTVLRNINNPREHADMLLRELRRAGRYTSDRG